MVSGSNELELHIDEYVDGRLDEAKKAEFEARLQSDSDLRNKVQTATQSIHMIRKILTKIEPSGDFEDKVSSQIISITQSNPGLRPARKGVPRTKLTSGDADAKLLFDPLATRENRRLMVLAGVAAALFAAAVAILVLVLTGS